MNGSCSSNFFLFPLGFASRKREEENKRREAEQQKGRLNPDSCGSQAPPCVPSTQAEPHRQSWTPSKQHPTSSAAQDPEGRACRGSPGRAPQREAGNSPPDVQGTDPRKPNGRYPCYLMPTRGLWALLIDVFIPIHLR